MKKIYTCCITLLLLATTSHATKPALVPIPNKITLEKGFFNLGNNLPIWITNDSLQNEALYIKSWLANKNITTTISTSSVTKKNALNLIIDHALSAKERYLLDITPNAITITGATKEALFRGLTTLQQLIVQNTSQIQTLKIDDQPRFEYRAIMLDPARHFIQVEDVKKFIDQIALFKYNFLHMHLSDDQGWRVEIKKYPRLTQVGSKRLETDGDGTPHEGFYTQDQLRQIVDYAHKKHIEIIPEIDVPGHSVAAVVAYPFLTCRDTSLNVRTTAGVSTDILCAGNEKVFQMYSDIYAELCDIFPSKYFHMGGDEAPLDNWTSCPKCQATKASNGFTTNQELMGYFFGRLSKVLETKGKTALFWYELDVPSYPKNTITYAWRMGLTPQVIEKSREMGCKVICAPGEHAYFDYPSKRGDHPVINWGMPILSLESVYKLDPGYGLPADKQSHIMGVEATLWSECIKDLDRTFYMTFPRAMALAEAGWSTMENRNWKCFITRCKPMVLEMIANGINVRVPYEEFKQTQQ